MWLIMAFRYPVVIVILGKPNRLNRVSVDLR